MDVVLSDDEEVTLTLPVPPPEVKVVEVTLTGPSKAYVNDIVYFIVSVKVSPAPEKAFSAKGELKCTGPEPKSYLFEVLFAPGETESSVSVAANFTKPGTYVCKAYVGGVYSNPVTINVEPKPVAFIPGVPPEWQWLAIMIIFIFILVIILVAVLVRASRRVYIVRY